MKIFAFTAALATTILSTAAYAQEPQVKPYVGFELGHVIADYAISGADLAFADTFTAANVIAGLELNEHVAFEFGYLNTGSKTKKHYEC